MPIFLIMSFFYLFIFVAFLLVLLIDSINYKITPTPSSKKVRETILSQIPLSLQGEFYELGSGFGDMTFAFSQKFKDVKIMSYEKAKIPYLFQKIWIFFKRPKNIFLNYKNFLNEDLSSGSLIFCYLYRSIMPHLAKKFEQELKKGSLVITHTFAIENWKAFKIIYVNDIYKTPIYIYQFGNHLK